MAGDRAASPSDTSSPDIDHIKSEEDSPLDFSIKKRDSFSEDEMQLEAVSPPPLLQQQQEAYKPGPTVFPQGSPASPRPLKGPPPSALSPTGLLGALPFLDPRAAAAAALALSQKGSARPFKSYPCKEPLPLGVWAPALPAAVTPADLAAAQMMSASSEELFLQYKQMVKQMEPPAPAKKRRASDGSTSSQVSSTSAHSEQDNAAICTSAPGLLSTTLSPARPPAGSRSPLTSNGRKRPRTMPDELKDTAYWERRRKNNEAAKRSRDARRAKEDEIAIRAAFLEQENLKLRVEVAALKNETSRLRCMLYSGSGSNGGS